MDINRFLGKEYLDILNEYDITVNSVDKEQNINGFTHNPIILYKLQMTFHSPYDGDIDFTTTCKGKYDFASAIKYSRIEGYNVLSSVSEELQEIRNNALFGKRMLAALEKHGISITNVDVDAMQNGETCVEMEFYSPENEDVVFSVWFDGTKQGFAQAFKDYADDFDPEEHAAEWYNLRKRVSGVPSSIRTLLDDADAIKETLQNASLDLEKAYVQNPKKTSIER